MLNNSEYEKIISFTIQLDKLKSVKRQNYKFGEEHETTAEHSWHIASMILLLKEELKELDSNLNFEKMLSLALIHDVPEIISGDFCPYDKENYNNVKLNEEQTSKQIYSTLPNKIGTRLNSLQTEFDKTTSKEAELVKALDKLQHLIQHLSSENSSYKEWKINSNTANEYLTKFAKDDISKKLLKLILPKAIKKEVFFNK